MDLKLNTVTSHIPGIEKVGVPLLALAAFGSGFAVKLYDKENETEESQESHTLNTPFFEEVPQHGHSESDTELLQSGTDCADGELDSSQLSISGVSRSELIKLKNEVTLLEEHYAQALYNFNRKRSTSVDLRVRDNTPKFELYTFDRAEALAHLSEDERSNLETWLEIFPVHITREEALMLAQVPCQPRIVHYGLQAVAILGKDRILHELTRNQLLYAATEFSYTDFVVCFGTNVLAEMSDYDSRTDGLIIGREPFEEWKNKPNVINPHEYDEEEVYY